MKPRAVQDGLQEISRTFAPILHESAFKVLEEAQARLFPFIRGRQRKPTRGWGYRISPSAPLRFKPTIVDELKHEVWVDIYCAVEWLEEDALPERQDIKIRVWTTDLTFLHDYERTAYDEQKPEELEPSIRAVIDRMTARDIPASGRVIYRCHFDKANDKQSGPKYHLQFGGAPEADEQCWLPKVVSLPRLVHSPYDLILTCELVASNFYLKEYEDIKKEATWMSVLWQSQANQLLEYYRGCVNALEKYEREGRGSLLRDHLWNK
jgi:hypothetical protein